MATVAIIAKRRAIAEQAIQESVSALAEHLKVELPESEHYPIRDLELKRVVQLEQIANQLAAINENLSDDKADKKAETEKAPKKGTKK